MRNTEFYFVYPVSAINVPLYNESSLTGYTKSSSIARMYCKQMSNKVTKYEIITLVGDNILELIPVFGKITGITIEKENVLSIYDTRWLENQTDYINFICPENFYDEQMGSIFGDYMGINYNETVKVISQLSIMAKYIKDPVFRDMISLVRNLYLPRIVLASEYDIMDDISDYVRTKLKFDQTDTIYDVLNYDMIFYKEYIKGVADS